jgi:hypothetical protein
MTTTTNKLWQAAKAILADAGISDIPIKPIDDPDRGALMQDYGYNPPRPIHLQVVWPPKTQKDLAVLSHEAGHAATTSWANANQEVLWAELKASLWGMQALARLGMLTEDDLATRQHALGTYLRAAVNPLWWDTRERTMANEFHHGRHAEDVKAFMAAKSLNDPKLQELLKGTYGRAD